MNLKRIIQIYLSSCWIPAIALFAFAFFISEATRWIYLRFGNAGGDPLPSIMGALFSLICVTLFLGILIAAIYQFKGNQKGKGLVSLSFFVFFAFFLMIGVSDWQIGREHWERAEIITGCKVTRALNCNTLELDRGRTVRLIGVDCLNQEDEAMRYLEGLFAEFGSEVRLEKSGDKKQYTSGHVLADVSIVQKEGDPDDPEFITKINVNKAMIGAGYGQADAATK